MRPAQITCGPLKLSVEPVLTGPSIEFTDYETDITWLSGPPFVNATIAGAPASQIALQNPKWSLSDERSVEIIGRLGNYVITITYSLLDNPPRLEEHISIENPTGTDTEFARLRIGSVISPPKSWWQYWAYWRLALIGPKDDAEQANSLKLSDLIENIRRRKGNEPIRSDITGLILTDEKRFLRITGERGIHLDVIDSKPSPIMVAGGIIDIYEQEASTVYIPGTDGTARVSESGR
jgi:hypothetical protein